MSTVTLTAESGASFLAASTRARLVAELTAADNEHTRLMQAAAGEHGDWSAVRQAAEVVRQCRAAVANLEAPATNHTTGTP